MPSRYQDLIHWKTYEKLQSTNLYTRDHNDSKNCASYEMLPINSVIHCQLIDKYGKNINPDGTFGNQLVWGKICNQKNLLYSDILYTVELLVPDCNTKFYTNASLINWPRPNKAPSSYLSTCNKDDSVLSVKPSKYAVVTGTGLNAVRKLTKSDSEERFLNECRKDIKNAELVCCDMCFEKNINPHELDDSDLNLAEIGGGYAHTYCLSEEQMELYEESLLS